MRWCVWIMTLICSGAIWAQSQVVKLRYELWWNEKNIWYGQKLEPTNATDAKLPYLSEPRFFIGNFVDGKRFFVLAMQDGQPILYADTDGDNDLTDEKPLQLRQRGRSGVFGPFPMRFRINERTVIQHFGVAMDSDDKQLQLFMLIVSRWTGTLRLNGEEKTVTVVDSNTNGAINVGDTILLGNWERRLSVGSRIVLDEKFYLCQVTPTGEQLTFEPIDAPKGQIRFNGEQASITLEGEDGEWILKGKGGAMPAPVGEFRITIVRITRKDPQGRLWSLSAYAVGPAAPKLRITEEGTSLDLEPLKMNLIWDRKDNQFEFSLDIKTVNGMSVNDLSVNNQRPPEPKLRLIAPNGKVIAEPKFHYG